MRLVFIGGLLAVASLVGNLSVLAQGRFNMYNVSVPTRLGSLDGPLAGRAIWAQAVAGPSPTELVPVGVAVEHLTNGIVAGGWMSVPTVPCNTDGYVQLVAWDGRLWGTSFAGVPPDQLGRTDIVQIRMWCDPYPVATPPWTHPAVVPIPEPSIAALLGLGVVVCCSCFAKPRRKDQESPRFLFWEPLQEFMRFGFYCRLTGCCQFGW